MVIIYNCVIVETIVFFSLGEDFVWPFRKPSVSLTFCFQFCPESSDNASLLKKNQISKKERANDFRHVIFLANSINSVKMILKNIILKEFMCLE